MEYGKLYPVWLYLTLACCAMLSRPWHQSNVYTLDRSATASCCLELHWSKRPTAQWLQLRKVQPMAPPALPAAARRSCCRLRCARAQWRLLCYRAARGLQQWAPKQLPLS